MWAQRPDHREIHKREWALAVTDTHGEENCLFFSIPTENVLFKARISLIWVITVSGSYGSSFAHGSASYLMDSAVLL